MSLHQNEHHDRLPELLNEQNCQFGGVVSNVQSVAFGSYQVDSDGWSVERAERVGDEVVMHDQFGWGRR
jgi:hypothetical protein